MPYKCYLQLVFGAVRAQTWMLLISVLTSSVSCDQFSIICKKKTFLKKYFFCLPIKMTETFFGFFGQTKTSNTTSKLLLERSSTAHGLGVCSVIITFQPRRGQNHIRLSVMT